MQLSSFSLTPYLLERGLLESSDIVDGDLLIIDHSRRNRNFELHYEAGRRGLFVKQVGVTDPQSIAILQREAACYWLAEKESALEPLSEVIPNFRSYDPTAHILVTDLIAESESLTQFHYRTSLYPTDVGAALARCLALVHSRVDVASVQSRLSQLTPGAAPWVMRLHREPQMLQTYGSKGIELFQRLQQRPEPLQILESLRSNWWPSALIHGDVKLDNFLRVENEDGRLYLIDWELADIGDPLWDVGSVFQAYLSYWTIFFVGQTHDPATVQGALTQMQPVFQSFWAEYIEQRELDPSQAAAAFHRSVVYAGARLLQTAFESAASQVSTHADPLFDTGVYLMTQPQAAARSLLGMAL